MVFYIVQCYMFIFMRARDGNAGLFHSVPWGLYIMPFKKGGVRGHGPYILVLLSFVTQFKLFVSKIYNMGAGHYVISYYTTLGIFFIFFVIKNFLWLFFKVLLI